MSLFEQVNGNWPDYPRAQLRAKLIELHDANGTVPPEGAIDEIVDLACHAAATARSALFTVIDSCSDPRVGITAIGPAISFLAADLDTVRSAQKDFAQLIGQPFFETTIGGKAHG